MATISDERAGEIIAEAAHAQRTCAERIEEQLQSRLAEIRRIAELQEAEQTTRAAYFEGAAEGAGQAHDAAVAAREDAETEWAEGIFCVDKFTVHRVCMSFGGPAEYFHVTVDEDGDITRIEYQYQDWGDTASVYLRGDDFEVVAEIMLSVLGVDR